MRKDQTSLTTRRGRPQGDDDDTRQKDNSITANTRGMDDDSLCGWFADGYGPAGARRGNDTASVGHGIC
ncbi:MAG: hypothetical protein WKF84_13990 [Pyrinomonadaceae bacterium]